MLFQRTVSVLIESDWNLKSNHLLGVGGQCLGINRIRLEFKVYGYKRLLPAINSINRIRLEFKGF